LERPQGFSGEPILDLETANAFELTDIGGHDHRVGGVGMGRDQQVIAADRPACRLEFGSHTAILGIGRNIERQDGDFGEQVLNGLEQPL
jgi:hypothetical protein